jgi:CHAD domain-containing protein
MPTIKDPTYRRLAADSILAQLDAIEARLDGARRGDVEAVHKLRVASRRMRAALGVFKPVLPGEARRQWRKQLRRLTRALGPGRDIDVQLEALGEYRPSLSAGAQQTLDSLTESLRQRRGRAQPDIDETIDRLARKRTLITLRKAASSWVSSELPPADFTDRVRALAGARIMRRLRELLAFEPWVLEPAAAEKHHRMRVATKKLRYTIELLEPIWAGQLGPTLETLKGFQADLGLLHDVDVTLAHLADFQGSDSEGLAELHRLCMARRSERFETFRIAWRARQGEGFWDELYRIIHSRPGRPPS